MSPTRTRAVRTQWVHRDEPKPEPVDSLRAKALRLPRPGPGIGINVPLHLLPEYLDIYRLQPMTRGEVAAVERASGKIKPGGTLYVKRIQEDK